MLKRFYKNFLEESRLLRVYLHRYRMQVVVGIGALVLVDFLDIFPPLLLKYTVDAATETKSSSAIVWAAFAYAVITLFQGLGRYLWRMYLIRASMWSGRDMRNRYAQQLLRLSANFFDKNRVGDLMSLATSDVEAIRMALGAGLLTMADALFFLFTVPFFMFWLSPLLSLVVFAPLLVVPFWVIHNERLIHERFKKVQESFASLSAQAQEGLNGIRVVKAYAREDQQVRRFQESGDEFIRLSLELSRVQSFFGPSLDFVMSVGLVLLLALGGVQTIEGALSLGTFVAFQKYVQKLIWPMSALGMGISLYQRAVASSQRYEEVVESTPDVRPPEKALYPLPVDLAGSPGPWKTAGRIEFNRLSFSYAPGLPEVVSDVDLVIEAGARVAFLGAVGSGKSSLLSLIPRLYPIERGMLKVDGCDVNDWDLGELRRQIGYVAQDVFLFSDSVAENVAFGVPHWLKEEGALSKLEDSARAAQVYDEILKLPQGWGTELGERGANLSGGQRQRLTIARALARDPAILILDDALAAVDTQTESAILKSLRKRKKIGTEIVAAHRVSTVVDADLIVVMAHGKILQAGKHSQLAKESSGLYAEFYRQQRLMQDLEKYVAHI